MGTMSYVHIGKVFGFQNLFELHCPKDTADKGKRQIQCERQNCLCVMSTLECRFDREYSPNNCSLTLTMTESVKYKLRNIHEVNLLWSFSITKTILKREKTTL